MTEFRKNEKEFYQLLDQLKKIVQNVNITSDHIDQLNQVTQIAILRKGMR